MNFFSRIRNGILSKFSALMTLGLMGFLSLVVDEALATTSITVPAVATDSAFDSGNAVFTALAAVLGIFIAIKVFKRL